MDVWKRRDFFCAEALGQLVGFFCVGDGNDVGPVALDLGDQFVEIVAGGQAADHELSREGFDDGEALASDGAGGTQDG